MTPLEMAGLAGPLLAAGAGVAGFVMGRRAGSRDRARLRRKLAAAQRAARRDPLTGLANRAGLLAELDRRAAGRETYAVLLIDLDGFKAINDTLGHDAGDVVLVDVAARLSALVGGAGMAARLGGDEFVLVAACPAGVVARLLGYDVVRAVARPIDVNGRTVAVRGSVGVVQALPGDDPATLLRSADVAMYRAKTGGGQAGVAEYDALLGLTAVEAARPKVRLRKLNRLGADLAEVA